MNNDQTNRIIDQYHTGVISQVELDQLIKSTPGLEDAYRAYQEEINLVKQAARIKLRSQSAEALKKHALKKKLMLAIISSAVIALLFFMVKKFQKEEVLSSQDLFAMHFEPMTVPSIRSSKNSIAVWDQYIQAYETKEYDKLIGLYKEVNTKEDIDSNLANLLLGICQIEGQDYSNAFKALASISDESIYAQEKEWYTALALLKTGRISQALVVFKKISNTTNHYKKKEGIMIVDALQKGIDE